MKPILLDTSGIIALLDRSERYHLACTEVMAGLTRPLITCEAVIAEACHLLRRMHGAQEMMLKNIQTGMIGIPWRLTGRDLRVSELMHQYKKIPMDFADACLVCMAEDFEVNDILTLDSDFEVYRWSTRKTFNILVDLQ
jgi:predicted nucleic acid-binding protein